MGLARKEDMVMIKFSPFPVLYTNRLTLRELSVKDAERIHVLRSDEAVNALIDRENSTGIGDALLFIDRIRTGVAKDDRIYWVICRKNSSELIGTIGYWNFNLADNTAEVGYELLAECRRQGFMNEVLPEIIRYGFKEMKLKEITAYTSLQNIASVKLLEKFGFQLSISDHSNTHENVPGLLTFLLRNPSI